MVRDGCSYGFTAPKIGTVLRHLHRFEWLPRVGDAAADDRCLRSCAAAGADRRQEQQAQALALKVLEHESAVRARCRCGPPAVQEAVT